MRALVLIVPWLAGCAFSDGEPFGEVSGTLEARYELLDDRDQGDGWQKLTSELEVRIDAMTVSVDRLELIASGTGGALSFDPASPPPGYTLCHNGHCHREDGALIPYEQIEADLSGGETATTSVALSFPGAVMDLVEPEPLLLKCDGPCVLGKGFVALVKLHATELTVEGRVRDGLAEPRFAGEVPLSGNLHLGSEDQTTLSLDARVELPLDDENGSQITLAAALLVSARLFDDVPLADLAAAGDVDVGDAGELVDAFGEQQLVVGIQREEP